MGTHSIIQVEDWQWNFVSLQKNPYPNPQVILSSTLSQPSGKLQHNSSWYQHNLGYGISVSASTIHSVLTNLDSV